MISAIHDLNIAAMYCDRLYAVKGGNRGLRQAQEVLTEDLSGVYTRWRPRFFPMSGQLHILYHPAHRL